MRSSLQTRTLRTAVIVIRLLVRGQPHHLLVRTAVAITVVDTRR
jgi:hypothetical protein